MQNKLSQETLGLPHFPDVVKVESILKPYVDSFIQERFKDIAAIAIAAHQDDWEKVQDMGHRIKGVAKSYGFSELGVYGDVLEKISESANKDLIIRIASDMERHLKKVRIIFIENQDD